MIKAKDAILEARKLLGTPYRELDCINLIKKVIRNAPGGDGKYTTAGTNTLWRSYDMSGKYRDLTWRSFGTENPKAGMLAFKSDGEDVHHVGLATGEGTVIHSSSTQGGRGVVETALDYTWDKLAIHKMIAMQETTMESGESNMESYKAIVTLSDPDSTLNVRNEPGRGGDVINKLFHGQSVTVLAEEENGWAFVQYGDSGRSGYVSGEYIRRDDTAVEEEEEPLETTTLLNTMTGETVMLVGKWKTAED